MSEHVIDFDQPEDPRHFRRALGRFATGVTIVTTCGPGGKMEGLTANSFTSVSLDPPLVLWSLKNSAPSLQTFMDAGVYAVNVLGTHQADLCRHFATPAADKFAAIDHAPGVHGCPLIHSAIARFECRTEQVIAAGDHVIFLGRVLRVTHRDGEPLIFSTGAFWAPAALEGPPAFPAAPAASRSIDPGRA